MRPPRPLIAAAAVTAVAAVTLAAPAPARAQHATPMSPACGSEIPSLQTVLVAANADDPPAAYAYQFQLFSDPGLTILISETPNPDGLVPQDADGTTSWFVPVNLLEDTRYYWRVRVENTATSELGPWSAGCSLFVNTVNEAPGIPRIDSPASGAQVSTFTPVLEVDDAIDPDLDLLHYQFSLFSDPALSNQVVATPPAGVAEGPNGKTSWQVPAAANLMEDHFYYWHARGCDPENLCGGYSASGQFFVSTQNEPPEAPSIVAPQNGSIVGTLRPQLVILDADDSDLDPLVYDWDLATDVAFTTIIDGAANAPPQGAQNTAFELSHDLQEDHRYCWRVRSDDGQAQSNDNIACFLVSQENDPPTTPVLDSPVADSMLDRTPIFSWEPSTDPEDEPIQYELQVDDDAGRRVGEVAGVSGTVTIIAAELVGGRTYHWRVRATDRSGASSPFSADATFSRVAPPADTGCCTSDNGCQTSGHGGPGTLGPVGLGLALIGLARRRRTRRALRAAAPLLALAIVANARVARAQHVAPMAPACGSEIAAHSAWLVAGNEQSPPGAYAYEFQLFGDANLTSLIGTAAVPQGAGATTTWAEPAILTENARYYWRVRVTDQGVPGPWSVTCSLRVNAVDDPPPAPVPISPVCGGPGISILKIHNATDPQQDVLHYQFEVFADPALSQLVAATISAGVAEGAMGTTQWQVPAPPLEEDHWYYWHARAIRVDDLAGPWSATCSFVATGANDPPTIPTLLTPQGGQLVEELRPTLMILDSHDADLDPLVYAWDLATDATFTHRIDGAADVLPGGSGTTAFTLSHDLEEDHAYCWRARADDGQAQSDDATACFRVSERNDPPATPVLETPAPLAVTGTAPVFAWYTSSDPEGDPVTYDLELKDGDGAQVAALTGIGNTVTPIAVGLVPGGTYTWRVRAVDLPGAASAFSDEQPFSVAPLEPPVAMDGGGDGGGDGGCTVARAPGAPPGGARVAPLALVAIPLVRRRRRRG
ncbi:MAG TPA: hypothetical protein VHE35_17730 [Kofleriaceae bacterium]|nr:hypothetical protein [Kofleriaceae bacterium]